MALGNLKYTSGKILQSDEMTATRQATQDGTNEIQPGGRLTTHVLDTSIGKPGAGITVSLFRRDEHSAHCILTTKTNADGRCDSPLLSGADFVPGQYELVFEAGDYFRTTGVLLSEPPFLDEVVIRFGLSDSRAHYHVPLLLSPWSYSTYRGS